MTDHYAGVAEQQARELAHLREEVDHWRERALYAESKLDGQAWMDLTDERDELREIVLQLRRGIADLYAASGGVLRN